MYPQTCNANIYEVVDNVFQYHYNNVTTCYKKQFSIYHDFSKKKHLDKQHQRSSSTKKRSIFLL